MQFSQYQTDFFDALRSVGKRNIVVDAVAGSGKTTTLVEASRIIGEPRSMVFLAFNKHIAAELQNRMPGVDCRTIHSLGFDACRRASRVKPMMSANKYRLVFDSLMTDNWRLCANRMGDVLGKREPSDFRHDTIRLSKMIRLTLTDPGDIEGISQIAAHHNIEDYDGLAIECAAECVERGDKLWQDSSLLDYDDMLWLPYRFGYSTRTYATVLVDELQDLPASQMNLALSALDYKGRFIGVGDPRQAIQGFAGADADSFQNAVDATNADIMPLSICYRCPRTHIERARKFVPQIEASPYAEVGQILEISDNDFLDVYTPERNDLIISRTNAPLVQSALKLISRGIQARVRGNDLSEGLIKLVRRVGGYMHDGKSFVDEFPVAIERTQDDVLLRLKGKPDSEGQIQRAQDQFECVRVMFEASKARHLDELEREISDLFSDVTDAVWLSSIHRAKGLESENVYVLQPDKMEIRYPSQRPWQEQQERNVHYVGLTRSKSTMYMVQS